MRTSISQNNESYSFKCRVRCWNVSIPHHPLGWPLNQMWTPRQLRTTNVVNRHRLSVPWDTLFRRTQRDHRQRTCPVRTLNEGYSRNHWFAYPYYIQYIGQVRRLQRDDEQGNIRSNWRLRYLVNFDHLRLPLHHSVLLITKKRSELQ